MKLRDIYARPGLTVSVEVFAPKTAKGDADLFAEVDVLKSLNPAFCSVTYGAGGSTNEKTLDIVTRLRRDVGLEVMCHLTVVAQPKDAVRAVLDTLKANDIENIIALRGDPPVERLSGRLTPMDFCTRRNWSKRRFHAMAGFQSPSRDSRKSIREP